MAAPKKGRSQQRPGTALAVILVTIVALVGGMFLSGEHTPRLGIDLAGGTSITLAAKSEPGQENAVNKTNLETAVNIIERRVNGVGVTESEVQTQGDKHIIVNIPKGTNEQQAKEQVGKTARLYFRPVLAITEANPAPAASPSASTSGKATKKPDADKDAKKGDDAKDAGEKAKESSSSSANPSSTTQGRAVSEALTKDDASPSTTPSQSAKAEDKGSSTPSPAATDGLDTTVTPELQKQLDAVTCAKNSKPPLGKPDQPIVACGTGDDKGYKYALGPAAVDGTDLDGAEASYDQQRGTWQVNLEFDGKGSKKFADVTGELAKNAEPNNRFAIVLDGDVVSSPSVSSSIAGGRAEISGSFTQQQAKDLANVLSYGALPLSFRTEDVTEVSAALGSDQLRGGLIAGGIGMALVILYSLAYYRGLAFVSVLSLGVSAILTYTIMTLLGPGIGFALNLPAVCGAIVAIGITADSFIVYFERIRDEIREGRSLRPAVERAWPRARRTILVSDFVSFLAAAVLYIVSVGKVQGFAFTLGLTTLLDVAVVFLFTKPMMTLLARTRFYGQGHKWSGLDPTRLGAPAPIRGRRRPITPLKEA
ncbi:preprotein translocase subunit SecD [Wenjunlia vitaminophila]|uniref:Protein translocase subunit SecD n=1 Tax=Wenjunlia vitaminophila TaxID=76728 RepID=A0A0T6LWC5_WENVI|nr:protein translocase subunit SecD [Wenjunlia vitaminophila]KRV50356.1 preprotein translocase subunit SecD [Wenjunlia vitaminophila]